jgi:cephalosporin hydroxylase
VQSVRSEVIYWLGYPLLKNPFDLWLYQQIIVACKPDLIIETGTGQGGSALYLASICDLIDHGEVITVDIKKYPEGCPQHPRIMYLLGDSVGADVVSRTYMATKSKSVMVILDSDHEKSHVLKELICYARLVTTGQYLIVEDTDLNGHPIRSDFGPGPYEAVEEWLLNHPDFEVDKVISEWFLFTKHPGGYLKRK